MMIIVLQLVILIGNRGNHNEHKCKVDTAREHKGTHRYLLDERMQNIAEKFTVETDLLLTHLLVYKLDSNVFPIDNIDTTKISNKKQHMECPRTLSKEKMKDTMLEWIDDLKDIKSLGDEKDKIQAKIAEMESRLLLQMESTKTVE